MLVLQVLFRTDLVLYSQGEALKKMSDAERDTKCQQLHLRRSELSLQLCPSSSSCFRSVKLPITGKRHQCQGCTIFFPPLSLFQIPHIANADGQRLTISVIDQNPESIDDHQIKSDHRRIIRSLGVVMDSQLTFSSHVTEMTRWCRFLLYNMRQKFRMFLSTRTSQILVQSVIISRLDDCNSLLAGACKIAITLVLTFVSLTSLNVYHTMFCLASLFHFHSSQSRNVFFLNKDR